MGAPRVCDWRTFVDDEIALRLAKMPLRCDHLSSRRRLSPSDGTAVHRGRLRGGAVAARAAAALVALGVGAWFVLGAVASSAEERAQRTVDAIARDEYNPTPGVLGPALADARRAARWSLDRDAEMTLASLRLLSGDPRGAWRTLRSVVRAEPRNADAVYALLFVSRGVDRQSVPRLLRQLRKLDTYAWRTARAQGQ